MATATAIYVLTTTKMEIFKILTQFFKVDQWSWVISFGLFLSASYSSSHEATPVESLSAAAGCAK